MTEEQIEIAVSRKIDQLDARYLSSSQMTQEEYNTAISEIDQWAENEYRFRQR